MTARNKIIQRARLLCAALALSLFAPAPAPALASTNWRIDPARTHIAFAIDAVGYPRTHGQFRQFAGRISVDLEHPDRSNVSFHVQSQSVDVGSSSFDDYLRSVAFLDSTRFPSIDFVSDSVAKVDDHTVRVVRLERKPRLSITRQADIHSYSRGLSPEPSRTLLKRSNSAKKIDSAELWPGHIGEIELTVSALPQQKTGQTNLTTCTDDEVEFR